MAARLAGARALLACGARAMESCGDPSGPIAALPFCDASLPFAARADDLLARLTLEEKPLMLTARARTWRKSFGMVSCDSKGSCPLRRALEGRASEDAALAT